VSAKTGVVRPRLHVNVDHVATLRQARGTRYPDPVVAASVCERAGADGITVHLREDRRHIQDRDVSLLRETVETVLNLEMAATDEMVAIAERIRPDLVTLVPEPEARCVGLAFRVPAASRRRVIDALDFRERGGYVRRRTTVVSLEPQHPAPIEAIVYVADVDNENYLGPSPLADIAAQVCASSGPSGPNDEYVLELADCLEALGIHDAHVAELGRLVRAARRASPEPGPAESGIVMRPGARSAVGSR